ncbi:MAG: hypothetical protein IT269_02860, partial [Saprospiraceae bacterium]|nr:hypothetical protein [Saprospiraceae bacterium]
MRHQLPITHIALRSIFLKKHSLFGLLCLCCLTLKTQAQNNARTNLNNQVQYIQTTNQAVERMIESTGEIYPKVLSATTGKGRVWINYQCPYRDEPYYRTQAQSQSGAQGQQLKTESAAFQTAFDALVGQCQSLDTYFKL